MILLLCINLFNYIDRQVLAAVLPNIEREFFPTGDPNAKAKLGLLAAAFTIVYICSAPIFGFLAERISRWRIIAIGVGLWSLASGASGLAPASLFTALLITRCFVGIGEGAYGPVAPTVISDLYPISHRGKVLAWFYAAIPFGGALGYALGGQVAASRLGWRWAFFLVVPPGLVLALWAFLMREPPRGAAEGIGQSPDKNRSPPRRAALGDYLLLARIPSYVLNCAAMTFMTFAFGGVANWMPTYLEQRSVSPVYGIHPTTVFGALTALGGLVATLAGGIAGDRLRGRVRGSYFVVSGAAMILGVPCFLLILVTPFPAAWIFLFLAVFLLFFNTGPTNTALANVTHPAIRATAFAVNILIIHALGDALSPLVIGAVADHFRDSARPSRGLAIGFAVITVFILIGGVLWLLASRYLDRDTKAAVHLLDEPGSTVARGS